MPRGIYIRTKPQHPAANKGKGKGAKFLFDNVSYKGDACLLWPYSTEYNGYGNFGYMSQMHRSHKFMCELAHGPRPSSKHEAAHSCGNALCVNPGHISWKTRSENELDKRRHGTASGGAAHSDGNGGSRTRLELWRIEDMRANKGKIPADVLAKRHGIKRGGVRYWQATDHDPVPPSERREAVRKREARGLKLT